MASANLALAINRTCYTMFSGVLFISVLSTNCSNFTYVPTNILVDDENTIQSDNILKTYTTERGISYSISGYNLSESNSSGVESVLINSEKIYNLKKLDQIATLQDGWNGEDASAFESSLIARVRAIITTLEIQPELFPTVCDSIQIEYEKTDGSYLEIELNTADTWEVFQITNTGEEIYFSIQASAEDINKVVKNFYG